MSDQKKLMEKNVPGCIKMNVLSLFDGMSCGQISLNRAGFTVDNYYAAEIDKYAIKVTQANYPNTIQLGDVTKWKEWDIDWSSIDLVTGGFPCQAWSLAGKQLGDKDPRGMLFWTMLDIIKTVLTANPNAKFLMENVKMKKEFEQYITHHTEQALGKVEKHLINSSLVSAQNRQRYYWTNIQNITQPEDKKIYLKDIIESDVMGARIVGRRLNEEGKRDDYNKNIPIQQYLEVNENPEKSNTLTTVQKDNVFVDRDKAHCLDANYFKGGNLKSYFEKHRRQLVFSKDELCHVGDADLNGNESIKRVYHTEGKSRTLTTMGGGHREPKILWDKPVQVNPDKSCGNRQPSIQNRLDSEYGKSSCLTKEYANRTNVEQNLKWRKLTPLECERLQTVPDNYTAHVSNSQRYKMLGNGWTVDVIAHIFSFMDKK